MEFAEFLYMCGPRGPAGGMRIPALLVLATLCWGCAGSHRPAVVEPVSVPAEPVVTGSAPEEAATDTSRGVHHVIQPGQTLWRIARTYGLTPETVARANGIEDPTQIAAGQTIFIPGATTGLEVPPYPAPVDADDSDVPFRISGKKAYTSDWAWPVPSGEILSYYGAHRRGHKHAGVDIRGSHGAKVIASRGGKVEYSGSGMRGYGKTVIIDHGDRYSSLYAHNSKLLVRVGERVRRGQTIARVGSSGNADGDHCHFEIRRDDRAVDPLLYLVPPIEARR
jgi:murein DD-endopeptidase MepM/ murein hydrolase activator NlpD